MDVMAPCPGCSRHLRVDTTRCPFCDAAIGSLAPPSFDLDAAPSRVRYAALALGATLALSGCPSAALYGGPPIPPTRDAGMPSTEPAYGGPPELLNPPSPPPDAGGTPFAPAPAYGLPPRQKR